MPIVNRVADLQPDIQAWRRDIHEHPELLYDVHRTAAFVADRLREFGCDEVATGLGKTGVVGVIKGKKPAGNGDIKVIGLRADMDALPIEEETNLPHASKTPGKMHACGHDGHTAMLLGAARYLAETRNFAGDAVVIFQPAEEGGAGAAAMIKDGLMDRFGIEQVYGMHNGPGIPVGQFAIRPGPIMAATDALDIKITGLGGHAARPHICIDSVLVGAQVITALQSIVSRSVDPLESAVISVCEFHAGNARNVIPQTAELRGTIRTLTPEVRELVEKRVREVVAGVAQITEVQRHGRPEILAETVGFAFAPLGRGAHQAGKSPCPEVRPQKQARDGVRPRAQASLILRNGCSSVNAYDGPRFIEDGGILAQ